MKSLSRTQRMWTTTAIAVVLFAVILYLTQIYWSKEEITSFITQFGPLSMIAYVAVVILFNVAAPLSASPIMLLGFSLYDQWAVWLFALGNVTAMGVNFWIARMFGRRFIRVLIGDDDMQKLDKMAQEYGLATLFIIRLFVSGLNDIASYAFGLTPIKFKSYMAISIVASIPPIILFAVVSQQFENAVHLLILQLLIGGAFTVLYLAVRMVGRRHGMRWLGFETKQNFEDPKNLPDKQKD